LITLGADHPITGEGLGMTPVLNPQIDPATELPYTAHNDFVRVFFEGGILGLVGYVLYGALLLRWALKRARRASVRQAPTAFAVVAALLALIFLTAGAQEWGTLTAVQFELYGMLALITAAGLDSSPAGLEMPSEGVRTDRAV